MGAFEGHHFERADVPPPGSLEFQPEPYATSAEKEKNFSSFDQFRAYVESLGSIPGKTEEEYERQLKAIEAASKGAKKAIEEITRWAHFRDIAERLFEEKFKKGN